MIISAQTVVLLFIVANIVITFLWCVFARASRGVVSPEAVIEKVKRLSDAVAEKVTYCVKLIHGFLPYELPQGAQEGTENVSYVPKTYKMSKYDDIWEEATKGMLIPVFLGEDIKTGAPNWACATKFPHGMICGKSDGGKSTFVRGLLECFAKANARTPLEVVAIDGKQTELHPFSHEKRVKIDVHFENDQNQFFNEVKRIHGLMYERIVFLRQNKCTDIKEYNREHADDPMKWIIFLVDEFGRLYKKGEKKEDKAQNAMISKYLSEIAEMARAAGIIMILTTQNPSCNVIPAAVFGQMGATMAFRLNHKKDSERVLNERIGDYWAHKLQGKGFFVYRSGQFNFAGLSAYNELSDFPWYAEYKGLANPKGKYAEQKEQANAYILSLLQKKDEAIVSIEDLAHHLSVPNDKKYRDSILMPVLADFPQKQAIKKGKKIHAYKITY